MQIFLAILFLAITYTIVKHTIIRAFKGSIADIVGLVAAGIWVYFCCAYLI